MMFETVPTIFTAIVRVNAVLIGIELLARLTNCHQCIFLFRMHLKSKWLPHVALLVESFMHASLVDSHQQRLHINVNRFSWQQDRKVAGEQNLFWWLTQIVHA